MLSNCAHCGASYVGDHACHHLCTVPLLWAMLIDCIDQLCLLIELSSLCCTVGLHMWGDHACHHLCTVPLLCAMLIDGQCRTPFVLHCRSSFVGSSRLPPSLHCPITLGNVYSSQSPGSRTTMALPSHAPRVSTISAAYRMLLMSLCCARLTYSCEA